VQVYGYFDFQNPLYMVSRHMMIPRIAAAGTSFSPLPCQAWHGYMVTIAHRVEVEADADGHASATPLLGRRRCAAGGRRLNTYHVRECRSLTSLA
jgi:hypothetical protein